MGRKRKESKVVILCVAFFLSFLLVQYFFPSSPPSSSPTVDSEKLHRWITQEIKQVEERGQLKVDQPLWAPPKHKPPIKCDRTHYFYDLCTVNGPTVMDPTASIFYLMDPTKWAPHLIEKIRPYPRKRENQTMERIRELKITSGPPPPKCEIYHNVPAIVFSAGGYTGNFFHDFNDGFIPLFITVNSVYPDQDVILVISKARDWWVSRYAHILKMFSKHPIINFDNDTSTYCFPSATLGLISHGFMTINPNLIPNSKTFTHFRSFLAKAYEPNTPPVSGSTIPRPRLVLLGRNGSVGRVLLNQLELKKVAEKIGFDVTLYTPSSKFPMKKAYDLLNSSQVVVGVHGAALTHLLLMRRGSVVVQVVPLGTEWVAEACFGKAAKAMGLEYIEYRVSANESSLTDKYGKETEIIQNPTAFMGRKWSFEIMNIYLKEQNVRLDLIRFRVFLEEAYWKAKNLLQN